MNRRLWAVPVILSLVSLFVGTVDLNPLDLLTPTEDETRLLFLSRIPRLISILLAGTGLGVAGLIMQHLAQNRLASPTTAGTEDAARFGVLVSLLLFPQAAPWQRMLVAFTCALAGTAVFMTLVSRVRNKGAIFVPLVGLMFGNVIGALTTFLAYRFDLIQNVSAWLQGNFSLVIRGHYELLFVAVPLAVLAYFYAHRLTIAGLGESLATTLGLNYRQVVMLGLAIVSLLTAAVILTVGMIPFVSLIVPNLVTMMRGDHVRKNLVFTAWMGATFILLCDIVGRIVIHPYEIPIGLMAGMVGSGLFLYLLLRGIRLHEAA